MQADREERRQTAHAHNYSDCITEPCVKEKGLDPQAITVNRLLSIGIGRLHINQKACQSWG